MTIRISTVKVMYLVICNLLVTGLKYFSAILDKSLFEV